MCSNRTLWMSTASCIIAITAQSGFSCHAILAKQIPAATQSADKNPSVVPDAHFEAVVISEHKTDSSGSHADLKGSLFKATNTTLLTLMHYQAFGLPAERITGFPPWVSVKRFDIEASIGSFYMERMRLMSPTARRIQLQLMFQSMLKDRFALATHWETREQPVYALRVDRKGNKLRPSADTRSNIDVSNGEYTAKGVTMADLAESLTQEFSQDLGRVVIDETRLEGRYDLHFRCDGSFDAKSDNVQSEPSLFTAVHDDLGLKLVPSRGKVSLLVVDHVQLPSSN